jgi:integrase
MATEKSKARRRGSIERLGDRKFKLTVYTGITAEGKRVYFKQVVHGTKEMAERRLSAILDDIANGRTPTRTVPEPEPVVATVVVGETLDRWVRHKRASRKVRARTVSRYEWLLNAYVKPVLGARPVVGLTELDIQDLYNGLLERGISPRTIHHLNAALTPALAHAVRLKLLPENPAAHVELASLQQQREMRYFNLEQTQAFLAAAARDKWHAAFLLSIEIGPRPNETLALRWADVDFDNHSISISRSLYWPEGGGYEFTPCKTKRSNRTVTISTKAVEALRQHRRQQLEHRLETGHDYQDLDLVFASEAGTPLSWKNLTRRRLKPLVKVSKIPEEGVSLYTLRHTSISLMLWAGVDITVVAKIVGTSIAMIDKTYGHIPQSLQRTATDRVTTLLYAQG